MGTQFSLPEREPSPDPFWPGTPQSSSDEKSVEAASDQVKTVRHEDNQKKLEVFKQELAGKREARHKAIVALTDKLKQLQSQIKTEQDGRIVAEEEIGRLKALLEDGGMKTELDRVRQRINDLEEALKKERREKDELLEDREKLEEKENQIQALREVASIGKEMLRIRELQVNELKKKLCETAFPGDLREEYELQIQNVRRLKTLYEERAETVRVEHQQELEREQARIALLEKKLSKLEHERQESELMKEHLKSQVAKLDHALEEQNDKAMTLREKLDSSEVVCKDLSSQMALINNLFSQVLLGNFDADRLTRLLQENQSLMTDLTSNDEQNDLAALLLNIAGQVDHPVDGTAEPAESSSENGGMTQEEVALNLSKVWRILVQLLAKDNTSPSECDSESCYKSVDTPSGPRSVISVSQTFITLKTLILEKNALIKEVGKLKSLNGHLETRLGGQEKRLTIVSSELKKTWGVVSKLRAQHKQLHTQEKILRYELQHKRHLLNELKEELERCRDKWDMARKKNSQSEEDWRKLRREFADRKNRQVNNSAESGYEDDESHSPPTEESMDEHEDETEINSPVQNDEITEQEELDFNDPDYINIIKDESIVEELNGSEPVDSTSTTSGADTPTSEHSGENNSCSDNSTEKVTFNDSKVSFEAPLENQSDVYCANEIPELSSDITRFCTESSTLTEDNESESLCTVAHNSKSATEDECMLRLQPQDVSLDNETPSETNTSTSSNSSASIAMKSTKITRTPHSAENISRFLDGLISPNRDEPDNNHESTSSNHPPDCNSIQESCHKIEETEVASVDKHFLPNTSDEVNTPRDTRSSANCAIDIPLPDIAQAIASCTKFIESEKDIKVRLATRPLTNEDKTDRCNQEAASIVLETLPDVAQTSTICQLPKNVGDIDGTEKIDESSIRLSSEGTLQQTASAEPTAHGPVSSESRSPETRPVDLRTTEEVLDARTARLKRLEEQCKSLFNKVTATTHKSNALSTKLELLHEHYGGNNSGNASSTSRSSRSEIPNDREATKTLQESQQNDSDKSKP